MRKVGLVVEWMEKVEREVGLVGMINGDMNGVGWESGEYEEENKLKVVGK